MGKARKQTRQSRTHGKPAAEILKSFPVPPGSHCTGIHVLGGDPHGPLVGRVKTDVAAVLLWSADRRAQYASPHAVYVSADAVQVHCETCNSLLTTDAHALETEYDGGRNLLSRFHLHCRKDAHKLQLRLAATLEET